MRNKYKKLFICLVLFMFVILRLCSILLSNIQQNKIIKRAKDMVYVKWIPSEDIPFWNSNNKFQKGKVYEGIPYTWSINQMRNSKEFLQKINSNNNIEFVDYKAIGPNYGNDCSGFVSAVWDIPRCTTHNIEKYTKSIDFKELKPGDALLTDEHIMLFSNWYDKKHSKITVYEQTPPKATMNTYSIEYLKSKKYHPIRLK